MDDEFVVAAQMAMEGLSKAAVPGAYWVEYVPLLKYLPSWFPGMSFRKLVDRYAPYVSCMREDPYKHVKAATVSHFIYATFFIFEAILNPTLPTEHWHGARFCCKKIDRGRS